MFKSRRAANAAPNSFAHPTLIKVDPFIPADQQQNVHNRWHPDIPSVATVKPNKAFKVECVDWSGGQIGNNDSISDLQNMDLTKIHFLSGPISVEGAEPGDYLVVDILDVQPFDKMPWGYTGSLGSNAGALAHHEQFNDKTSKAIWDFHGVYTTSRHIPGTRFVGLPHPSVIGTAPSHELLAEWQTREEDLIINNADLPPPVVFAPGEVGAYVGQNVPAEVLDRIKKEGARTLPGREHGGNTDIKNLSRGSRCYFPVFVKGAKLSVGDLNFSKGDGKMSFCGGIGMAGIITLKTNLIKNGVKKFALKQPMFVTSPVDPTYSRKICFQGLSVNANGDGKQYFMDTTVAFAQAALNAIDYLVLIGYTREQAYLLLSAAPVEAHVAAIVDNPNACVTIEIPIEIFDHDILPRPDGHVARSFGQCAT